MGGAEKIHPFQPVAVVGRGGEGRGGGRKEEQNKSNRFDIQSVQTMARERVNFELKMRKVRVHNMYFLPRVRRRSDEVRKYFADPRDVQNYLQAYSSTCNERDSFLLLLHLDNRGVRQTAKSQTRKEYQI